MLADRWRSFVGFVRNATLLCALGYKRIEQADDRVAGRRDRPRPRPRMAVPVLEAVTGNTLREPLG